MLNPHSTLVICLYSDPSTSLRKEENSHPCWVRWNIHSYFPCICQNIRTVWLHVSQNWMCRGITWWTCQLWLLSIGPLNLFFQQASGYKERAWSHKKEKGAWLEILLPANNAQHNTGSCCKQLYSNLVFPVACGFPYHSLEWVINKHLP